MAYGPCESLPFMHCVITVLVNVLVFVYDEYVSFFLSCGYRIG